MKKPPAHFQNAKDALNAMRFALLCSLNATNATDTSTNPVSTTHSSSTALAKASISSF